MFRHGCLALAAIAGMSVAGCQNLRPPVLPPDSATPPDLRLSPDDENLARALSHYGWGLYLQQQAEYPGGLGFDPFSSAPGLPGRPPTSLQLVLPGKAEPPDFPVPSTPILPPPGTGQAGASAAPAVPAPAIPPGEDPSYIQHFREALWREPDARELLEAFTVSLIRKNDLKTLILELEALAAENPAAPNLCLMLAEVLELNRDRVQALAVLRRGLEAGDWHDLRLVQTLAENLLLAGQMEECEKMVRRALKQPALRSQAGMAILAAEVYQIRAEKPGKETSVRRQNRNRQAALLQARRAYSLLLETPDAETDTAEEWLRLGNLFQSLNEPTELLKVAEQGQARFPEDRQAFMNLQVRALLHQNQRAAADKVVERLLAEAGDAPANLGAAPDPDQMPFDSWRQRHQERVRLGQLLVELERYKDAIKAYENALKMTPGDIPLRMMLGHLYLAVDQPDKALEVVRPINDLLPQKKLIESHAYAQMAKTAEAARMLALAEEAALKLKDDSFFDKQYYLYYANLCADLGALERSLEKGEKALALDPADPESANFVGYLLADLNRDLERAEKLIRQALAKDPENVAFLDSLAWVHYRQGRFEAALTAIRTALKLSRKEPDPVIFDHAGDIAAALSLWEEAAGFWNAALQHRSKEAEKIREKLKKLPSASPALAPAAAPPPALKPD